MSMRKISADWIYSIDQPPLEKGVLILDAQGKVLSLQSRDQFETAELEIFQGIIIPGFINTHCHLELSHMKGVTDTGIGLLPFLKQVVQLRHFPEEQILSAIEEADHQMYQAKALILKILHFPNLKVGASERVPYVSYPIPASEFYFRFASRI